MFSEEKQTRAVYRYKIKAATTGGFCRVAHTSDYALGESLMHVWARGLRSAAKPGEEIVITMFDMTIEHGTNIVAQYEKTSKREGFKSFVSDTIMPQPVAGKEIYYE